MLRKGCHGRGGFHHHEEVPTEAKAPEWAECYIRLPCYLDFSSFLIFFLNFFVIYYDLIFTSFHICFSFLI